MKCPTEEEIATFLERWQEEDREGLEEMRLHFLECSGCMDRLVFIMGMGLAWESFVKDLVSRMNAVRRQVGAKRPQG